MITYQTTVQPRQVRLELSSACLAKCVPCHRNSMTRPVGHMDIQLLLKCLSDIRDFPQPLIEVVPTGWGEFQCNFQWERMLLLISQNLPRTRMVIPTNGAMLTDGAIDILAQISTLKVFNLSVNAIFPETYEAFNRLPAKHLGDIEKSALKLKKLRPDILIWASMVYSSEYQSPKEKEMFEEHWNQLIGPGTAQVVWAQFAGREDRKPLTPVLVPCRSLFSDICVFWNGQVVSGCCWDAQGELGVGDVNKDSLIDIWHGKAYATLRQKHNGGKRGSLKLCASCTFA